MTSRTRRITAAKSTSTDGIRTPYRPALRADAATFALASIVLVGTHP